MSDNHAEPTQVLIVGAGPVGLALAIELGLFGVRCVLVEQRDGKPRVPRMSQVSSRIMEYCRRWGIADKVRNAVWSSTHPLDFVYLANLTGEEVGRFKVPSYAGTRSDFSPEGPCACPQIYFDPILAEKAMSLPTVNVRYHTRLESFEQIGDAVHATIVDGASGKESTVTANYLIGCDGAAGIVRQKLKIPLDGPGKIANSVNIFFRSPELAAIHDKGWARFYRMIDNDGCWAELIAIDGRELWRLTVFDDPSPAIDSDACLRRMAGCAFPYEIIDVSRWERRDYLARSYRSGAVLIAGDSAHECSPTGGLGMHTGICEVVNLAWKLTALLGGWGGARLLDSYEAECRPVAKRFVDLSTETFDALAALPGRDHIRDVLVPGGDVLTSLTVPERLRALFGYDNSPICKTADTDLANNETKEPPTAGSGARAPHGWLNDGRSVLDLFGDGFVLLRFGKETSDVGNLVAAARKRRLPLEVIDIAEPNLAALYQRRLVLVRPDRHIAWSGNALPENAEALVDHVRGA